MRLEERLAPATFVATQLTDGTGPGTLRWAILQADQTPGSNTVLLRPGTYTLTLTRWVGAPGQAGALEVQGNVTIAGAGPRKTQINANALGDSAFHVTDGNVTFSNLTITGGHAAQGGGILIDTGNIKIVNCVLASNAAAGIDGGNGQGGALYQNAGSLDVSKTAVTGNFAQGGDAPSGSVSTGGFGEGGGFYLNDLVTAHLSRDTFLGNSAQGGQSSSLESSAGGTAVGGAIRAIEGSLTITGSTFAQNRAIGGAGIDGEFATSGGEAIGGAISVKSDTTLILTRSALSDNQAIGGTGGNGPFGGDGGNAQGGGIDALIGCTISASSDTIAGNAAVGGNAGAGGVAPRPYTGHRGGSGNGGAIHCQISTSSTLTNSAVLNNVAQGGGGGDGTYGGNGGQSSGGAVWSAGMTASDNTVTASDARFAGNRSVGGAQGTGTVANGLGGASSGGALNLGSNTTATLDKTVLENNSADGPLTASGGAIASLSTVVALTSDTFSGNKAAGSPGNFGTGGAIDAGGQTTLTAASVTFLGNMATGGPSAGKLPGGFGQGGAVDVFYSQASFRDSMFKANLAVGGAAGTAKGGDAHGGAIETIGGSLDLLRTTFASNRAVGGASTVGFLGGSGQGGALFNDPASSLTITGAAITRNQAVGPTGYGGGIYLTDDGQPTLSRVEFSGNVATTAGPNIFPSSATAQNGTVTDVRVSPPESTAWIGNTAYASLIYNPRQSDERTIKITVNGPGTYVLNQTASWGVINNSGKTWNRFVLKFLKSESPPGSLLVSSAPVNGKLTNVVIDTRRDPAVATFTPKKPTEVVPTGSNFELTTQFTTTQAGTITIREQPFSS